MYLAFNTEVHFHETTPPTDTTKLWVQSHPLNRVIPSTSLFIDSRASVVAETQHLYIYEFERTPTVLVYSADNNWEPALDQYMLISSDGYVLKDSTGTYLTTRRI